MLAMHSIQNYFGTVYSPSRQQQPNSVPSDLFSLHLPPAAPPAPKFPPKYIPPSTMHNRSPFTHHSTTHPPVNEADVCPTSIGRRPPPSRTLGRVWWFVRILGGAMTRSAMAVRRRVLPEPSGPSIITTSCPRVGWLGLVGVLWSSSSVFIDAFGQEFGVVVPT